MTNKAVSNISQFRLVIRQTPNILRWGIAIIWVFVAVFPIWWTFSVVLTAPGTAVTQTYFPTSLSAGLDKIAEVLAYPNLNLVKASGVTFIYALLQAVGIILVTSLAAYEFAFFDFPGKNFLFILALSALMVPPAVTLIPLFQVIVSLKWMNSFQGLVVPSLSSALALFIFRQFMESLPKELIDAAQIDGASHFSTYRKVIMPLAGNATLTVMVWAFVVAWANYLWPLVVLSKPEMYTVSLVGAAMSGQRSWVTLDFAMTVYFLSALPPIVLYIFLQRYITQGFAMSGLKG